MSATDELRRLLDERGVEWESKDVEGIPGFHDTRWNAYDVRWCYVEFVGNNYTKLVPSSEFHCTPEQAIAATLGSGALTAEQVQETVEKHWHDLSDEYDMPEATALPEYSYDWQTITDELNSRAERVTDDEWESYQHSVPATEENMAKFGWVRERTCHETMIDKFFHGCDSCGYMWQFFYSIGKRERPNYCPNCGSRVVDGKEGV